MRYDIPVKQRPVPVEPVFPPDYEPGEYDPEDECSGPMEPPVEEPEEKELEDWVTQ